MKARAICPGFFMVWYFTWLSWNHFFWNSNELNITLNIHLQSWQILELTQNKPGIFGLWSPAVILLT